MCFRLTTNSAPGSQQAQLWVNWQFKSGNKLSSRRQRRGRGLAGLRQERGAGTAKRSEGTTWQGRLSPGIPTSDQRLESGKGGVEREWPRSELSWVQVLGKGSPLCLESSAPQQGPIRRRLELMAIHGGRVAAAWCVL